METGKDIARNVNTKAHTGEMFPYLIILQCIYITLSGYGGAPFFVPNYLLSVEIGGSIPHMTPFKVG